MRVAATLSSRFLQRRDRVGLVTFGGVLRWLEPGTGLAQSYRLVDALLETGVEFSYAWKDVNVIPARTLPPRALVVAVTPLLDERSVAALVDLRGRGHDLVVLELSPEPYVEPGEGSEAMRSRSASGAFSAVSCALGSSGSASRSRRSCPTRRSRKRSRR